MNIAKALKIKKRLALRIKTIQEIILKENVVSMGTTTNDLFALLAELDKTISELVIIKAKIHAANSPIAAKLETLGELKSSLLFFKSLPVGPLEEVIGYNPVVKSQNRILISSIEQQERVKQIQNTIDALQDEIDDFNAATLI